MYEVGGDESLARADAIPRPDPGTPMPIVLADDDGATVAYYAPSPVNSTTARPEEEVVVLKFGRVHALMFGAPNDEALCGHPLASLGLEPYAAYRVEHSPWVRRLERLNRVHHEHRPDLFARMRHYIVAFHDTTFECVCLDGPDVTTVSGTTPLEAATAASPRRE